MEQKDYALIIASVGISAMFAIIISSLVLGNFNKHNLKAPKVQAITSDFTLPDSRFFNETSFNPTQVITIGGQAVNENPFKNQ